ncbi:MAG: hypothetical protein HYZ65_12275 [Burkholderiales bacterium]|nr:hypothetical protein [Burkholderiales bacterium]
MASALLLAAHQVEPALHTVLEKEFPFFDAPKEGSPADASIFRRLRDLLEEHHAQIRYSRLPYRQRLLCIICKHSTCCESSPRPRAEKKLNGHHSFTFSEPLPLNCKIKVNPSVKTIFRLSFGAYYLA